MGSNYSHVIDERFIPRKIQHGNCTDPRIHQHTVDRTRDIPSQPDFDRMEEVPSQSDETQINNDAKKWLVDGSTDYLFGCLPEAILHEILSRLSICNLLRD
jgi:hypothetical protein